MSLEKRGQQAWKATVASAILQLPNAVTYWNNRWLEVQDKIKARSGGE